MYAHQSAVIGQFCHSRAEVVGASRFFNNDSATLPGLLEACLTGSEHAGRDVLCIQDTTELNYERNRGKLDTSDDELGPVGNDKNIGFFLHPSLVLDAGSGFALGYGHVHMWNRSWDKGSKHEREYKRLPLNQKESYRWLDSSLKARERLREAASVTIIADREADIYEEFALIPDAKTHLLIRSRCDRITENGHLYSQLASTAPCGSYTIKLKGSKKRKQRKAKLLVRYTQVVIKKPKTARSENLPETVSLYAIEVREEGPSENPVLWRLLTTHQISSFEDAKQIIHYYSQRWNIEQLFRLLKNKGLCIENSQIEEGIALKKLAVLALMIALVLLQLVSERDADAKEKADVLFDEEQQSFLIRAQAGLEGKTVKQQNPHSRHSLAWAIWLIARLGGWDGYGRASPPGPITMKRGMVQFASQYQGWLLAQKSRE